MTRLVDDQLLSAVLRGETPVDTGQTYTTGYWYVRLCQAVLGDGVIQGTLSSPFAALPADQRDVALRSLLALPPEVKLVSLRELAPIIGQLRRHHALNVLGMEVLAAAVVLDATVMISAPSPRLEAALASEGCSVEVLG